MKLYFAALLLPEDLNNIIHQYKVLLHQKWGCAVGLKSPAHITYIPPFWMAPHLENLFLVELERAVENTEPFPVSTTHFETFGQRTIFIEPMLDAALSTLKATTDLFCKTHTRYGAKPDARPFHPHITLATRDLSPQHFAEAWALFAGKTFRATFTASGLSVLSHNGKIWNVIHTILFTKTA